jgi:hypothetical protein
MSENDIHVSSPGSQLPSPVDKFKIDLSGDASDAISPNSTARGGNGRRSVPGEDSIPGGWEWKMSHVQQERVQSRADCLRGTKMASELFRWDSYQIAELNLLKSLICNWRQRFYVPLYIMHMKFGASPLQSVDTSLCKSGIQNSDKRYTQSCKFILCAPSDARYRPKNIKIWQRLAENSAYSLQLSATFP